MGSGDLGVNIQPLSCERDAALIAEQRACLDDDHCPCGAHCELGRCIAECLDDEQCEDGERCDVFGRCQDPKFASTIQPPIAQARGSLRPANTALIAPPDRPVPLLLEAEQFTKRVRLEGKNGAQIRCPDRDAFKQECVIEGMELAPGAQLALEVRRAQVDGMDDAAAQVVVHSDQGSETVTLLYPEQAEASRIRSGAAVAAPEAGRYEGIIRLVGAGAGEEEQLGQPGVGLQHGVRVSVWDNGGDNWILSIEDPIDLLTREEVLVGEISAGQAEGTWDVKIPRAPFLESIVAGQSSTLVAETTSGSFIAPNLGNAVRIEITQRYKSSVNDTSAPSVRWLLELERLDEPVEGSAPNIPEDAPLPQDLDAVLDPWTPWEARFDSLAAALLSVDGVDPVEATYVNHQRAVLNGTATNAMAAYTPSLASIGRAERERRMSLAIMLPILSPEDESFSPLDDIWRQDLGLGDDEDVSLNSVNVTGELPENGVSCAFTVRHLERSVGFDEGADEQPFDKREDIDRDIDVCAVLEDRFGCISTDIQPSPAVVSGSYEIGGGQGSADAAVTVYRTCKLPELSRGGSEFVMCMGDVDVPPDMQANPWSEEEKAAYRGSRVGFDAELEPNSGDLRCESDVALGLTLPFDVLADKTGREMLDTCLSETSSLSEAPPEVMQGSPQLAFNSFYAQGECAHLARTLTSLALDARASRAISDSANSGRYATAVTHRILSRWLALHAFYANQGEQMAEVQTVLSVFDEGEQLPESEALFDASLQGWDLLATPSVLRMLATNSGEELDQPDYRLLRGLGPFPPSEQAEPLATHLLDVIARQSLFLRELFTQPGLVSAPFEKAQALMPKLLLAQALAATHYGRASTAHGEQLAWREAYLRESSRASSALNDLLLTVQAASRGENSLGITDEDLPLYFDASVNSDASRKFSAISDFILGRNDQSDAIAPAAVARAEESFTQARTAVLEELDRRSRQERDERLFELRIENIRNQYNARLREFCGPVERSLVDDPSFDPMTCAIADNPECKIDYNNWYKSWTENDIQGRFCMARELARISSDDDVALFVDADVDAFAKRCIASAEALDLEARISLERCASSDKTCLTCDNNREEPLELDQNSLAVRMPESFAALGQDAMDTYRSAISSCRQSHPGMRLYIPLPSNPFDQPGCVNGEIGSVFLDVADAVNALRQANAEADEHLQAYDIAYTSCTLLEGARDQIQDLRTSHVNKMVALRIAKSVMDAAATAARGVKECFATVSGASMDNPFSAIASTTAATTSCFAGGAETAATIASDGLQTEIDIAERRHDEEVSNIQEDTEVNICFNDARQELVGMRAASIAASRAAFDIGRANADASDTVGLAYRTWASGHAYLKKLESREVTDASGERWANENIDTFARDFKLARRATYLAVRAVEYEYQSSLAVRQAVFDARTPTELRQDVLQVLWQDANTRSVNGSRPTEFTLVMSLRDDIWRLGDESTLPSGLRPMAPAERFRTQVASERFAVYDRETGRYLGQQIPFSLAPLGAFGSDPGEVPIYSQADCAERLWSLNVSLQGADIYAGSQTTNVRVEVRKQNTFYSQWCGDAPSQERPFQVASVRPYRNLFREPGLGADFGETDQGTVGTEGYSSARIQAFFNVSRAEFEQPDYAAGQTDELAARGLYGEYALFIPAELISRDGGSGVVLNNLDDVFIRLDYVSVASQ